MTDRISSVALAASFSLHALLALPVLGLAGAQLHTIYEEGSGNNAFVRDQSITVDLVSAGDAAERIEIAAVEPESATPTPPPVAPQRPLDPVTPPMIDEPESPAATSQLIHEPPPPPEPSQPKDTGLRDRAAQTALLTEKNAGMAADGGKTTALSAYVGKIYGALQRAKAFVSSKGGVGQVTVGFTLDDGGKIIEREVIESSGVASLDKAAVEWLDRAEFPPLPGLLAGGQRFNVPLTFKQKSS